MAWYLSRQNVGVVETIDIHQALLLGNLESVCPRLPNIGSLDDDSGSIVLTVLDLHDWSNDRHDHRYRDT